MSNETRKQVVQGTRRRKKKIMIIRISLINTYIAIIYCLCSDVHSWYQSSLQNLSSYIIAEIHSFEINSIQITINGYGNSDAVDGNVGHVNENLGAMKKHRFAVF